ncbi:MAG: substrate-binding domain-containing protein, partial [Christensenellales bacterium]
CIQDNGLTGQIKLTGLGLPSEMADYIKTGVCEGMYLWNPIDLGYLASYACLGYIDGSLTGEIGQTLDAGRLGTLTVLDDGNGNPYMICGDPFHFVADNIDDWKDVY